MAQISPCAEDKLKPNPTRAMPSWDLVLISLLPSVKFGPKFLIPLVDWWDFYYYNITAEHNHDSGLLKEAVMGKVTAVMQTAVGNSTITPR